MRIFRVLILISFACVLVVTGIVVAVIVDIKASQDGAVVADERVLAAANALTTEFGYQTEATDAESIAATRFGSASTDVQPVGWSGSTELGDEAIIDIRIRSVVQAQTATAIFGSGNSAGTAERCYRFTLVLYTESRREELDCDDLPRSAAAPTAAPTPALPHDAAERIEAALLQSDSRNLAAELRNAFPDTDVTVDTALTEDGELVAAVGIGSVRDCVVMVRDSGGVVLRASFDRIQLEPGELGCSVQLYTAPPL